MDWKNLAAEFPRDQVTWRAQTVTKNGDKALALAYIDARDVMNRLDEVCGPANWQDSYVTEGKRVICTLSIRCEELGEWVSKSDGAGDTAVEAEKGGISDAFKRAAVKWGIGRYLYDLPTPWVPCESKEYNGKRQFVKFADDPWKHVKSPPAERKKQPEPHQKAAEWADWYKVQLMASESQEALLALLEDPDKVKWLKALEKYPEIDRIMQTIIAEQKARLRITN